MTARFVTPAPRPDAFEAELLTILGEEAAETIQRATKAMRFGLSEVQPGQGRTNAQRLAQEIGDFLGMVDQLIAQGLLAKDDVEEARRRKLYKLIQFMQAPDAEDRLKR